MGILYKLELLNDTEDVLICFGIINFAYFSFVLSSFVGSLASIRVI
jgi:hypothetical protein